MPKPTKFTVGDIVKLKSGGPDMTIQGEEESTRLGELSIFYRCLWFAGKKLEFGKFAPETLEHTHTEQK